MEIFNEKTPFKLSNDWVLDKEIKNFEKSINNANNIIDQDLYNLLKSRLFKKCLSLGILKDDEKSRIVVEDLIKMAIYCFPLLVDQEQLNLIGEIIIWGFLLDDVFEEVPINRKQYESQQLIWLIGNHDHCDYHAVLELQYLECFHDQIYKHHYR
ncbi:hypothetical protein ACTFIZ_008263 [Dictyostelium cf. discoideum]